MEGAGIEEGMLGRREAEFQCIEVGGGEVERKLDMHMKVGLLSIVEPSLRPLPGSRTSSWLFDNA